MQTRDSTVLSFLLKEEASISRLYGGIHYRSDIERGKAHGARTGRTDALAAPSRVGA
jgi:hypothetical protein